MGKSHHITILRAKKHLYRYRGDAHVGPDAGKSSPKQDCLHWCVAPGVLDALALETLYLIHQPEGKM